jgi:16S rRNA G966 N2-methylase RsmD
MTDTVWAPDGSSLVVHADNADFLPSLPDGAFTLIYVDPPFNTGRAQRRQQTTMVANADGGPPDPAVLRHHARPGHCHGAPLHDPAHPHPRR